MTEYKTGDIVWVKDIFQARIISTECTECIQALGVIKVQSLTNGKHYYVNPKIISKGEKNMVPRDMFDLFNHLKYYTFDCKGHMREENPYEPKRIIYNNPATIVFWKDGTKTIVKKAKGEKFNEYNAFCAALAKKIFETNSAVTRIVKSGYDQKAKKKDAKK